MDCDLRPTIKKYNIASKYHQPISFQKLKGRYHKCNCSLQKEPTNTQKVIVTWKSSLPKDRKVASRDSLIEKGGKRERGGLKVKLLDPEAKENH